jgi:cytochrome c peroxidase
VEPVVLLVAVPRPGDLPYFHNGSAATLPEVVRFYDRGGVAAAR